MNDYMLDLETLGTRPDRAAIIQIAAVRFDFETGEVSHDFYDRALHPMPHRGWDEDTRLFWAKYPKVFNSIITRAEDPYVVLEDFANWVGYSHPVPPRLWARPISFEAPFIESHFHDAGVPSPFHYRHTVDVRSWMMGKLPHLSRDELNAMLRENVPFEGDVHNALHDSLHQLAEVFYVQSHCAS